MSGSQPFIGMRVPRVLFHAAVLLASFSGLFAQTTVGTGSIVGTVSDPSGAVISGAKVTITNVATGQFISVTANSSGAFSSGALIPGSYKTVVSAKGFSSAEAAVKVLVGNTATVNVSLRIGNEKEVVEVQDFSLRVNTEQATVQGVLNEQQIENLPVNGRNFLDLAQLEPGVQIQDGGNLGKDGYSSISFGGRFGRTARIEVDGIDVSDEIFGSTTQNIAASAIQEFQLSQSSHDLSTELTNSGSSTFSTVSARCSMSKHLCSSPLPFSSIPATLVRRFMRTTSWPRQIISCRRCTCSTASAILRTHSWPTGDRAIPFTTAKMSRELRWQELILAAVLSVTASASVT